MEATQVLPLVISGFALVVSFTSLLITARRQRYDRRLDAARKRTDLAIKGLQAQLRMQNVASLLSAMRPTAADCQAEVAARRADAGRLAKDLECRVDVLERLPESISALELEQLAVSAAAMVENAGELERSARSLSDRCKQLTCPGGPCASVPPAE